MEAEEVWDLLRTGGPASSRKSSVVCLLNARDLCLGLGLGCLSYLLSVIYQQFYISAVRETIVTLESV